MQAAILLCALLILTTPPALTQEPPALGRSHFSAELDLMFLQHRTFETEDGGAYLGIAGYWHLDRNWYLGGEIGAGFGFGIFSESSTYVPLEVNAKKAWPLSSHWIADVGAGLSYNRIHVSHQRLFSDDDWEVTEWVFGGQVLGDFIYTTGGFHIGLKLKYKLTADLPETTGLVSPEEGWDYSNFKIGIALGVLIPD
jgi:hypothetical protein